MRVLAMQIFYQIPIRTKRYACAHRSQSLSQKLTLPQRIEHAGYHRSILQRNPPRYDPDGDIVEIEDEYDDEEDLLETVEENPYSDIQLERMSTPGEVVVIL